MFKKFLLFPLFIFLLSGVCFAFEFSADTVMTHKGGGKTTGKIYYKSDRFRMDMKAPEQMIMITRMDKKVIWNIMPAEKMYMELPFDLKNRPMVDEKFEGEIERKHIGNETIDGHPTKKYLITYKSDNKKHQVYQWWATDINFPVKTAATDGSWVQEYKNIKIGTQPDSLFELPKGYKKFQFPGGMNMRDFK
jgi:outer membrane lipoprotein-sorting protein